MAAESGREDLALEISLADSRWAPGPPLSRYSIMEGLLQRTPYEFEFFQAVRLLERLLPNRSPVGRFVSPDKEVVRFAAHPAFPFPASQIQELRWPAADGNMPVMVINFMGLTGPSGVLPLYYTELIMDRVRSKDPAMIEFFDLFNHRMVSLFYQAWEKYRFTVAYERGERDRFSHHLMDLIGMGTTGLTNRLAVLDDSLLFYAGLLSMHARSPAVLEQVLWDYFDVPVRVEQFVGAWHPLDEPDMCIFDRADTASEQLGGGAIVGDEIWNQQAGVRIKLGPLTLKQYLDFLPAGTAFLPLKSLANFVARGQIDFELQLILKKQEVPACELGPETAAVPRLGWTSWAMTMPRLEDADDTIFSI